MNCIFCLQPTYKSTSNYLTCVNPDCDATFNVRLDNDIVTEVSTIFSILDIEYWFLISKFNNKLQIRYDVDVDTDRIIVTEPYIAVHRDDLHTVVFKYMNRIEKMKSFI